MAEKMAQLNNGELEKYSTVERQVGVWIDNSPVYRKVYSVPAVSTNTIADVATEPNIIPIRYMGYGIQPNSNKIPLPYGDRAVSGSSVTGTVVCFYSNNKIQIATGSQRSLTGGYLVVDYIKTS